MGGGNTETKQSHPVDEEVALSGVKDFVSVISFSFIHFQGKKEKKIFIFKFIKLHIYM